MDTWHRKYGQEFWLKEYERFGSIFFDHYNDGGEGAGAWQRGRKLVASLPGNHDLGFGAQVQVPVRNRFEAFFGDTNRVDVVGNHTIVSIDAVSLSAESSEFKDRHDLTPIYGPVNEFLQNVKSTKRKAALEELSAWHGVETAQRFTHAVNEVDNRDSIKKASDELIKDGPDFPTILLTHVPLYREPGTPCGPHRDHWPPATPPKGQTEPVNPDHRNALSISAGYQYQNVLSDLDSQKLVQSVGNVVHVFSGDDHDHCDVVHSASRGGVREITVKSLSMAMGVPRPGFVMASLWNPVDDKGNAIPGSPETTLQTHLCLLPNQIHTYIKYVAFIVLSIVLLGLRALLVPVLNLTPFAINEAESPSTLTAVLPLHSGKHKIEPPDLRSGGVPSHLTNTASTASWPRARSSSLSANGRWHASKSRAGAQRHDHGWARGGPRINLDEQFYDPRDAGGGGKKALGVVGREMWTSTWRVAWMAVLFWVYLSREK